MRGVFVQQRGERRVALALVAFEHGEDRVLDVFRQAAAGARLVRHGRYCGTLARISWLGSFANGVRQPSLQKCIS